jgi:hypothetical protein
LSGLKLQVIDKWEQKKKKRAKNKERTKEGENF